MNAVVIGSSHGLGFALVKKLLAEGHKVVAGTLEKEIPDSLIPLTEQYGDNLAVKPADVTNEDEMISFAQFVSEFTGKADAVCTVAGIMTPGDRINKIQDCIIPDIRRTIDVNTVGPIIAGKYLYPVTAKGGKILTITSEGVGVRHAWSGSPGYALSKTAATKISGIFNSSVDDVDFYSVHPGRPMTNMNKNGEITAEESAEGIYNIMTGITPVSRDVWYIDYKGSPMDM